MSYANVILLILALWFMQSDRHQINEKLNALEKQLESIKDAVSGLKDEIKDGNHELGAQLREIDGAISEMSLKLD